MSRKNNDQLQSTQSASHPKATLEARWGDIILDTGHTSIPNLLLELYSELGISNNEMMFIIHIFHYRWTEKNPHPAISTIARKMNVSDRCIQLYIKHLKELQYQTAEDKKARMKPTPFLTVTERYRADHGQLSNIYDFSGLTRATVALAIAKGLVADPASKAEALLPGEKFFTPPGEEIFTPPVNSSSPKKEKSKKKKSKEEKDSSIVRNAVASDTRNEEGVPIGGMSIGNGHGTHLAEQSPPQEPTPLGVTIQARITQLTQHSQREQPTLQNGYTAEEDAIAIYIEDFSRILHDEVHTKANVTQAINVYYAIKREIPDMTIEQYLYVLETFKDVVRMRANVKKRGAYYFTCLRNCLWNPDQGYHVPTREEGYGQKENWAT